MEKSFIFIDLLRPEAKNPPNGPIVLAKSDSTNTCMWQMMKTIGKDEGLYTSSVTWLSSQVGYRKGTKSNYFIGQAKPGMVRIVFVKMYEKMKVKKAPPKYPSQVFLGDSAIS